MYFRGPVLTSFDGREWRPLPPGWPALHARPGRPPTAGAAASPCATRSRWSPATAPGSGAGRHARSPRCPGMAHRHDARPAVAGQPPRDRHACATAPKATRTSATARSARPATAALPGIPWRAAARLQPAHAATLAAELRATRAGHAPAPGAGAGRAAAPAQRRLPLHAGARRVSGQHSADEFWFDRREGFCEHIASAFVILMRALDVPARIVTGYQGGERNSVDGFWTVRQSDAHAWAEVWEDGPAGCVWTPPARVARAHRRLSAPAGAPGR
jgi:hypothetical protein